MGKSSGGLGGGFQGAWSPLFAPRSLYGKINVEIPPLISIGDHRRCAFIFFFIGGVQPRKVQVDDQPRTCPDCGLPSARLKRLDHYLSIFFIPLVPIKRGEVFLECNRCGGVFDESGGARTFPLPFPPSPICPRCGRQVASEYKFCPHCGERIP